MYLSLKIYILMIKTSSIFIQKTILVGTKQLNMMYLLPKIYIQYAYVPLVKTSCTVHILVQKKGQKQSDKPCQ
jgi:hypothetical protein